MSTNTDSNAATPFDLDPADEPIPGSRTSLAALADTTAASSTDASASAIDPSATATFDPATGLLSVFGDGSANTLTLNRNAAGGILVNGGAVAVTGGTPTVANTALLQVFGQGGADIITVDESNGALPRANLFGGNGNDTITGGSGADQLFGQAGNDVLFGKGGSDLIFGGAGNDTLVGGDGDDQMYGEAGNDRMIWNPGDDSDLMEGGDGVDTAEVNGGNGAEQFSVTANGARVRFDRINPAPFALDIGTTENLVVNMNGGDDTFSATGNLAALINLTVDGGTGDDTILGGNGNDLLLGGDGNDFVDGNQGADTALLGAGDDLFQWDPGDGSDVVDGQDGFDTLRFNGSNVGEIIDLSAKGARVQLTRNVGNVTMDVNGVEQINFNTVGGADSISVHNLAKTEVTRVNIDLSTTIGSGVGDNQTDIVTLEATSGKDNIEISASGTSVAVTGLSATVQITGAEGIDRLVVLGLGGNDVIDASTVPATSMNLTLDGGAGSDTLIGGQGNDFLIGGDGSDAVTGGRGDDAALLGAGNDSFTWNPGDGSDLVEGQDGTDTLQFNGSNVGENIDIAANGSRVRFLRDVGNIAMDLNGIEKLNFAALGGSDRVAVHDLTGTDVTQVNIDLAGSADGSTGDGQTDTVAVDGSAVADTITISASGGNVIVKGLAAQVSISHVDAMDQVVVNGLGGDDVINAGGVQAGKIDLQLFGGDGNDMITGSAGDDLVVGGRGGDLAFLGKGNDTFVWNPGDGSDVVEGQAGTDTLLFNGANVGEIINISADAGRVSFTRNVANIAMDLNDVEHIQFNALGGVDTIVVNDLSGTAVTQVAVDLSATGGASGDGAADSVIVTATGGDDVAMVSSNGNVVTVNGLHTQVTITNAEANLDKLIVNLGDGDDVLEASGLAPGHIGLVVDGGKGDDVLIGTAGNDTLLGGDGDDVLIGNGGIDVLDGGAGDNVVIAGGALVVQNFLGGAGSNRIDLSRVDGATDFGSVEAHAHQVGGDVVIDFGDGDVITLLNVSAGSLHADSFLL